MNIKIKDITLVAFFSAILFVQEQLFSFLPNIQLTVFLIVLYTKTFKYFKTIIIILIHCLLDNLINGSFILFPFAFIGWCFIPVLISIFANGSDNPIILAIIGIFGSFLYSWMMIIPNVFIYSINIIVYLSGDIIFELILAFSSFLTILWLYNPCKKLFNQYLQIG